MSQLALKWIFVLEEDYAWPSGRRFEEGCAFEDNFGKRRMEIRRDGEIRVLKGYAWDGCTPKITVWDIVIGTPDGVPNARTRKPKTYYASLLHDALYQFIGAGIPLSRYEVDRIFLEILQRDGFAPRNIYYFGVRIFGGLFGRFTRWKRHCRGRKVPL